MSVVRSTGFAACRRLTLFDTFSTKGGDYSKPRARLSRPSARRLYRTYRGSPKLDEACESGCPVGDHRGNALSVGLSYGRHAWIAHRRTGSSCRSVAGSRAGTVRRMMIVADLQSLVSAAKGGFSEVVAESGIAFGRLEGQEEPLSVALPLPSAVAVPECPRCRSSHLLAVRCMRTTGIDRRNAGRIRGSEGVVTGYSRPDRAAVVVLVLRVYHQASYSTC